jgi:hypothetical protein
LSSVKLGQSAFSRQRPDSSRCGVAAVKGNASQEVLLSRGWLKILARAKYRFADG